MRLKQFIFALTAMLLSFASPSFAQGNVAKVGNTEYATIDEAVAAWSNNTTLTLLADVTLSDVVTLKSTEHHILNLGTYTMTAASGKNAFVIQACGTGSAERSAITINADATNPGGINAGSKCVVYYKYADGGISTEDRPIIKINGGVFTGSTSSWGTAGIYTIGTAARKCATVNVAGGTFNCSIVGTGKSKLIVSGGVFNYTVSSQGDSTCSRLISGGTFKNLGFMTADSNNTKFWIGTSMGNSNVGVHVDDNGYIVVGGPVVTEAGETFEASSANYSGASSYLQYSSAATEGLYYTSVEEALADNKTGGSVTVYVDELDMTGISYNGTIVVPADSKITITNAPSTLVVKDENGNALEANANGTYTTVEPKGNDFTGYTRGDAIWGEVWGNATESFVIKVLDADGNVMGTTSLNNIGGIIDGDVNVTWSLKFDATSNTDEYWTMAWTTAPTIENMPAKVELWVDGVKVSGGNVVLNAPDDLSKIYAAVTDANGKILSFHTDVQEAIKAAAAVTSVAKTAVAGTVELLDNVTVDKWIMFTQSLTIGTGQLNIVEKIDGLTIDGNNHSLTIKSIESAGNGGYLFYDAQNLTVKDLTINIADGLVGGIALQSGTISNVTFNGGQYAVLPGSNGVIIDGCTFNDTKGYAVYYENERPGIVVTGNTFNTADGAYAITMRSNEQFTDNTITKGRVNLANSAASTVSGNDFGTERFKVYNGATATISNNEINNLVFNETNAPAASTFTADNTLSAEAQAAIDALPLMAGEGTEANPYTIANLAQLKAFRDDVNAGNNYQGKFIKLTTGIDLNNEEWTPIAYNGKTFKGSFDGGNNTIMNLKITKTLTNSAENNGIGLFGRTDDPATIKNLTIENVDITGSLYVGAAVGRGYTGKLVENVTVKGNIAIDAWWYAGVIGGNGYVNTINNCHVIGNDDSYIKGNDGSYIGGIWGFRGEGDNKITNCTVTNLDIQGVDRVGGISGIGHYGNSVKECAVNNVKVTATDPDATTVGLIVGACQGTEDEPTNFTDNTLQAVTVKIGDVEVENPGLYGTNIEGVVPTTNYAAKIGSAYYENFAEAIAAAQAGETVSLLKDVTVADKTVITKAITLDLNGKKVTSTAQKAFEVYADATIKNGAIEAVQRCVDTRKAVKLTLTDVTLIADEYTTTHGNPQPLTIGGSENGTEVVMTNVNISAAAGYGIITFVKTELTATNSTIGGYNALYVKSGSDNSTFNFVDSDLSGSTLSNDVEGNSFSVIAVRANNVTVNVDDASTVTAKGNYSFAISFIGGSENTTTGSSVTIAGGITGNILDDPNGNTVKVKAEYADELAAAGYVTIAAEDGLVSAIKPVAKIGDTKYATLAEAVAAAQAGDEIVLLGNVAEDATLPAGITFNGNGKTVGNLIAGGDITFTGDTKATSFDVENTNTTVNIVAGACLEITGTGRMVIGHGCTFNITGSIENAKTADVAALTPSLIIPGASFTGAGVTFNVNNAYISAPSSYCSSSKYASGTFDFNFTNSIWESAGKLAFEAQSTAATVNFDLENSVLNTGSHLVFAVSSGEVVIDNSNVNVGTSRQIENRSTMTIKNGSVVNGAVATSSNAINPGTIIVENATYSVTGEFSGAAEGTGTLVIKEGANVSAGSITKANIQIDATGMAAGDEVNLTADLSKFAGTIEVVNNNLDASIVGDKIVLAVKPVAKIGDTKYATLAEAVAAAESGATITLMNGEHELPLFSGKELTFVGESKDGVIVNDAPAAVTQGWSGSTFHFENLTAKGATENYHGLANGVVAVTYKNCNINGLRFLYANTVSFEDCAFNAQGVEHSFWTYGSPNITVKNSTFTYTDRAVNCYSENGANHEADITFEGCSFTYAGTNDAPEGAVEINSGSSKSIDLTMNGCTAPEKGEMWFNSQWDSKNGENTVVAVDDVIVWQVLPVAKVNGVEYKSLQAALNAAAAGTGNVTVEILRDVDLTGIDWNPVTVSAPGYPLVTVEGNGKTITGLNDMLFHSTWAGNSGLIIKNLTIANSTIENDKDDTAGNVGVGAFIGFPQASETITLENCHLVNSSVEGGHWTGGLIGMAGGYNGNDGPVFMNLTIKGCSVTGSTITGKGSVGGVIGHGSCAAWTNVVIEETTVSGNTITSTGSSNVKAGAVMGTIGAAGQSTTANGETKTGGASVSATVAENTVKSNGTEITTIYGRQGTETGMLYLNGGTYDNNPVEENVAYAKPAEGYKIEQNIDGTYGVVVDPAYGKVAKIGETYYETLKAAVEAAQAGETITLLADIEATEVILLDKSVTINGNGHKVTSNATRVFRVTTANTEVTLNDVNMVSTAVRVGTNDVRGISIDIVDNVKLTLNNCSVDFTDASANDWAYAVNVTGGNNHVVTVNGGAYEGANVINVNGANNNITVKNAVITCTYPNNPLYYGACIWVKQEQGSSVEATGNTFNGSNAIAFNLGTGTVLTESANTDNTEYVVAMIGDAYYTSIQAAVEAAENGATITVINDFAIDEMVTVAAGKELTIDLNGKTITGTDNTSKNFSIIDNRGNLTIKDSSAEKSGKITLTATIDSDWGRYSAVIANNPGGKLTIDGGTLEHLGGTDMAYGIDNLTNGKGTYAETVINGGTIKSTYRGIRQFLNGIEAQNILTINGGTIEGANKSVWMQDPSKNANTGTLTIAEGAKLVGDVYLSVTAGSTEWPVEVSIAAAALQGDSKVVTSNVPAGYELAKINNTYSVALESDLSASVNGIGYKTLAEAITAAQSGDVITFLQDITENVTINKNVTIDGADKKYTGTMTANSGLTVTVQNVNFVNGGFDKSTKSTTGTYTIKDCTFDGAGTYYYAFKFKGANKVIVEDCTVRNYLYSFLYVTSGTNTVSVKDVTVENCSSYAVYFSSGVNSATFENLTVKNSNNGFVINNTANRAFTIKDCTMENVNTVINHSNGTNTITCTALGVNDFGTDVLSEYAVINGATITGTNYYGSVQGMVEKAVTGQTVQLLSDIELDATGYEMASCDGYPSFVHVEGKAITVDLNGKTIDAYVDTDDVSNFVIGVFSTDNGGELTLVGNSAEGTGTVNLEAAQGKAYSLLCNYEDGCKMTINGGTYKATKVIDCLVYSGGTTDALVTVNGGNFTLDNLGQDPNPSNAANGRPWIFNVKGAGDHYVLVNGGTFNADINRQHWSNEVYVAKECYTVANTDGTYTVKENAVAYVNEGMLTGPYFVRKNIGYATLGEAFAAADDNDTVTLLKDIEYSEATAGSISGGYVDGLVYTGDKDFTVDFAGYKITDNGEINDYLVYLKNTGEKDNEITFKNGKVVVGSTTAAWAAITVGSNSSTHKTTLNLNNMEVINGNPNDANNQVIRIRNGATANLNDGTLVTSNGTSYGVVAETASVVNINSGAKVVHTNSETTNGNLVYTAVSGNGTINIYDGAVIESDKYGIHNMTTGNAVINIEGGTITAPVAVHAATNGGADETATVNITGGTINGVMEVANSASSIIVSGGVFDRPVKEEFCAEGYAPCDNADGTYGVYYAVIDEVNFVDGEFTEYNNSRNMTVGTLTYKRSSIPTTWTPFYVPFEVPVSQLAEHFEVAYINGVRRDDKDFDGELDEFAMEVIYIHGGNADGSEKTLKANYPYFIRSKGSERKDLYIELYDALLYAAKNATYDCSTFTEKFEITGNASQLYINSTADVLVYGVSGGVWTKITTGATLNPFRFYMTLTSRDGSAPVTTAATAASMSIVVRGEELPDGTTLIYDINAETGDNVIYDLNGRRVLETEKGNIYIINGKKVLVK